MLMFPGGERGAAAPRGGVSVLSTRLRGVTVHDTMDTDTGSAPGANPRRPKEFRRILRRVRYSLNPDARMNSRRRVPSRVGGFSAIELVVAVAIIGSVCLFATAYLSTIFRREKAKSAVREIYSLVLATRMQAVKRNQNVVLHVNVSGRELVSWADAAPANYLRDAGEPVLNTYRLPTFVALRDIAGAVNGPGSVSFDQYEGNATLVDRIVFRGDGSLVGPQATNSQPPVRPGTYTAAVPTGSVNCLVAGCRGIFLADRSNSGVDRNLFRISVDDFGRIGKASLLKWLPEEQGGNAGEKNFVPPPWRWVD